MRNFFYAPLIALMLLFVSCSDSDGVDDGTGDLDSDGVAASFVVQPQDVSFDTNLQRWDSKTAVFSVDPGSFRISIDSFSWKADSEVSYGDYFTTSIKKTDVDNEFEITFRTLAGAEALTDSLEVDMTLVMIYNGFNSVEAEPFKVVLPADKYSSYFVEQPTDALFKAGFQTGDYCDTHFIIDPQDAIYGELSMSVEESENFSVLFFPDTDGEENEYIARFTAKQPFVSAAAAALAASNGTPSYDYNVSVNEKVQIKLTIDGVDVEEPEIYSEEISVIAELADEQPQIISVSNIDFGINFEDGDIVEGTIVIDPGTKYISRYSFSISENDNYEFLSFAAHPTEANTYIVYLSPTELAIGGFNEEAFEESATITMAYDDYDEAKTLTSDSFTVFFGEDCPEPPAFTSLPEGLIFVNGSTTATEVKATFILDDGTYTSLTADDIYCRTNDYYDATFVATGNKDEYEGTFTLKQAAYNLALGSEPETIEATISVYYDGETGTESSHSDPFEIAVEGRLGFNHYLYRLTSTSVICHVDGFDAAIVPTGDIWSKGVMYTTDATADRDNWFKQTVGTTSTGSYFGGIYEYESIITGLLPNMTYYIVPYVEQEGGYSYGDVTTFTTYSNMSSVPTIGATSWSWASEPSDTAVKTAIETNVTEAVAYYNIFTSSSLAVRLGYDSGSSTPYISAGVITLVPGDYSVGRIMNMMMTFAGVGESTWTQSMISGSYYNKTRGNDFYRAITNQAGTAYKMPATSTGINIYDLVTSTSGSATLDPSSATESSLVKFAAIMGCVFDDGLLGYDLPSTYDLVEGVNVALNKTATAYAYASTYVPAYAVDGDRYSDDSRWVSTYYEPTWLMIDLEDEYDIIGFNFFGGSGNLATNGYDLGVASYQFQYWNEAANSWVDIVSVSNQARSTGCFSKTFDAPVTCSKVRLYATSTNQYTQMRVYELQVMTDFIR